MNVNPDLQKERANPSFPVQEMIEFLAGGKERYQMRKECREVVHSDPILNKTDDLRFLSREQIYERAVQKATRVIELQLKGKFGIEERRLVREELFNENFPTDLHDVAFLPYILSQGDEEQVDKWLNLAFNYQIIGSYSQTEIGHGSNVQGLETTATFDKNTDEFVLHTPTLSSIKFWPGNLGKTSTHTIVIAQLIIDGKKLGTHPFMLQVRSLETHEPLPGITVGDIGPKVGMNGVDNGFLKLDHVRIPRRNMMMRWAKVHPDGRYEKPQHAKLSYLGMISIRAGIVSNASNVLSKAVTIAIRYSCVRRQFAKGQEKNESQQELQILDYTMQQYRLFGLLASTFALKFTGVAMTNMYNRLMAGLDSNDASALPEVHASSSGLKSLTTWIAADGTEECRRACGGHGFLLASGLGDKVLNYVGLLTAEGENFLLTQQTARYLLKAFQGAQHGKPAPGNAAYLGDSSVFRPCAEIRNPADFLNPATQLRLFRGRAAWLVKSTAESMAKQATSAASSGEEQVWNNHLVEIARISNAHCYLILLSNFLETVAELEACKSLLAPALRRQCDLFALWVIEQDLGGFLASQVLAPSQVPLLQEQVRTLLRQIRPEAVNLVDSFDWTDFALGSALGAFDGRAYERLWEASQQGPMNKDIVTPSYRYLRPLIRGDYLKSDL